MLQFQEFNAAGYPNVGLVNLVGRIEQSNLDMVDKAIELSRQLHGKKFYILDCSNLEYVDYHIMKWFIHLINRESQAGNALIFSGLREELGEIFEVLQIKDIAPVFKNSLEALQAIKEVETPVVDAQITSENSERTSQPESQ